MLKIWSQKDMDLRPGCKTLVQLFNPSDTQLHQCHIHYKLILLLLNYDIFPL